VPEYRERAGRQDGEWRNTQPATWVGKEMGVLPPLRVDMRNHSSIYRFGPLMSNMPCDVKMSNLQSSGTAAERDVEMKV
jgi:hypothetical protein